MEIRPIRTNDDLTAALARIDALWGKDSDNIVVKPNSIC